MTRKTIIVIMSIVMSLGFCTLLTTTSHAGTAETLPKGVSRASVDSNFYKSIKQRYDEDGNEEDVAEDFNGALDSTIFPALQLVEAAFGMPPGSGNIGDTEVDFEYDFIIAEIGYQYGITDRLSVGVILPYYDVKNHVDATVNTTNATVGTNSLFNQGILPPPLDQATFIPTDPAFLPPGVPPGVPVTDEQVQDLLGDGLDVDGNGTVDVAGFGYDRFETWDDEGIGDLQLGAKYQYLRTENWRLAFTGGVQFPTGEKDDPDKLTDYGFGSGAYALLFRLHNDYVGIKNLALNATFSYDLYLPEKEKLRVPSASDEPITPNEERVDRDLGDVIKAEVSGAYEIFEGFSFSLLYEYSHGFEDDVDGDKGFRYKSLEEDTDWSSHIGKIGLAYSTIPLYRAKKFPVPLIFSVSYRNRFAGDNNVFQSQYIGVGLAAFF
jgi:hypothetical protein